MMHGRRLVLFVLVVASVSATCIGFVLPWAKIDLEEPSAVKQLREAMPLQETLGGIKKDLGRIVVKIRRGAETITGDLPSLSDIPREVSGIQVPQLANQKNAQVVMALFELFTNTRQQIGLKSYAVYLLPGLALLCGVFLGFFGDRRLIAIMVGLLCAVVAGVGFWKLMTVKTKTLFIAITIGQGLWLSLWGYVGLTLAAALASLPRRARG